MLEPCFHQERGKQSCLFSKLSHYWATPKLDSQSWRKLVQLGMIHVPLPVWYMGHGMELGLGSKDAGCTALTSGY